MNQEEIIAPFRPIARQSIHIIVSTKFRFQRNILSLFGPLHLVAINTSVNPFILPMIKYNISFDCVHLCVVLGIESVTLQVYYYFV